MGVRRWAGALILAAGTACGQPAHHYVANADEGVYVKVPREWHQVDQAEVDAINGDKESLDGQLRRALTWSVAYDAAEQPSIDHLFQSDSSQPVVFLRVMRLNAGLQLTKDLRDNLSLNSLRDITLLPVSEARRTALAEAGIPWVSTFEPLYDEVLNPTKGLYGVRSVFNYKLGSELETFDLTALADDKHSRLYVLVVRCTARCYRDRYDELAEIVGSFTVRGEM